MPNAAGTALEVDGKGPREKLGSEMANLDLSHTCDRLEGVISPCKEILRFPHIHRIGLLIQGQISVDSF